MLVLIAALPSASNVPILAERFDADAGRLARVVLFATVGAFASFNAAVAWIGVPLSASSEYSVQVFPDKRTLNSEYIFWQSFQEFA